MLSAHMTMHPRAEGYVYIRQKTGLVSLQPSLRLVLGVSDAVRKIADSPVGGATPDDVVGSAASAGLHFIDNVICHMRDGGPTVEFLLPADHGLRLTETHAVLVDVNNFAITAPLPLVKFTQRTVPRACCRRLCTALCVISCLQPALQLHVYNRPPLL
jgi:hypothetical protein